MLILLTVTPQSTIGMTYESGPGLIAAKNIFNPMNKEIASHPIQNYQKICKFLPWSKS